MKSTLTDLEITLDKINHLYANMSRSQHPFSALDMDLLKHYLRQFYEGLAAMETYTPERDTWRTQAPQMPPTPRFPDPPPALPFEDNQRTTPPPPKAEPPSPPPVVERAVVSPPKVERPVPPPPPPPVGKKTVLSTPPVTEEPENKPSVEERTNPLSPPPPPKTEKPAQPTPALVNKSSGAPVYDSLSTEELQDLPGNVDELQDSLNDQFSSDHPDLASRLKPQTEGELRRSIDLNERFLFIRELFGGDSEQYNRCVRHLDGLGSAKSAVQYLKTEIITRFEWDMESNVARHFMDVVQQHLPN